MSQHIKSQTTIHPPNANCSPKPEPVPEISPHNSAVKPDKQEPVLRSATRDQTRSQSDQTTLG